MNDNFIAKELTKILKSLARYEDRLRLLGIYLMCYSIPDSDFKTILSLVDNKEEKEFLTIMRHYNNKE